jgi:hypothetical protein
VTFGLGNRCSIRLSYGTDNDFNGLANCLGLLSLFYLLLIRAAIGGMGPSIKMLFGFGEHI